LRNVRWQEDRFEEEFTFTPIGLALRAQGTPPASGDHYLPVDRAGHCTVSAGVAGDQIGVSSGLRVGELAATTSLPIFEA
jgi:hypothetical protein